MAIAPRSGQLASFASRAPQGPLVMLNLLAFRDRAVYADGRDTDLTGEQAYGLYAAGVGKLIAELGGRPRFAGRCHSLLIGEGELAWDAVAIVEYPSLEAFRRMTESPAYREIHVHREAGLAHQLLIHCLTPEQAEVLAGGFGATRD